MIRIRVGRAGIKPAPTGCAFGAVAGLRPTTTTKGADGVTTKVRVFADSDFCGSGCGVRGRLFAANREQSGQAQREHAGEAWAQDAEPVSAEHGQAIGIGVKGVDRDGGRAAWIQNHTRAARAGA